MRLHIQPLDLDEANALVEQWHRHHKPVPGGKFAIGVADESGEIHGAAIAGRPVNRTMDNGWALEVTRCVTDGSKNACSALYAACWRAARAMGYQKAITYIHATESGVSLIAAGWRCVGQVRVESWHRSSRPRVDKHPLVPRLRFEVTA